MASSVNTWQSAGSRRAICALWMAASKAVISTASGANARIAGSEEHTSELQSLMRTSYAVFCLKNNTPPPHHPPTPPPPPHPPPPTQPPPPPHPPHPPHPPPPHTPP